MSTEEKIELELGPVGHATLASIALVVDQLANEIEFKPSTKPKLLYQPDVDFPVAPRLGRLAALGLAIYVASRNIELTGVTVDNLEDRLMRAGTPKAVATDVASKARGRRHVAQAGLSQTQRAGAIEAIAGGSGLTSERA
jgi:hypothetical protein